MSLTTDSKLDKFSADVLAYFKQNTSHEHATEILEEALDLFNPKLNRTIAKEEKFLPIESFHAGVVIPAPLFSSFVAHFADLFDGYTAAPVYTIPAVGYAVLVAKDREAVVAWLDAMEKLPQR